MGDDSFLEIQPAPSSGLGELTPGDVAAEIPRLVAGVSPASRAVIVLHYLHELTLEEVAEILGIGLGTVKSRLAYGLAHLRRQLQNARA